MERIEKMKRIILYIHGQGGNAEEATHYVPLFPDAEVIGFPYRAKTPLDACDEFPRLFDSICGKDRPVTLIANSIGAFYSMLAFGKKPIRNAYFISPIVDLEKLTEDMMSWANVSEKDLREKGEIETSFGQTLCWNDYSYVKKHPPEWKIPTRILYGGNDDLTSLATVSAFAAKTGATLTVMENGAHWFHTEEQMRFLDRWIQTSEAL